MNTQKSTDVPRREILERLDVSAPLYEAVKQRFPVRWPRYYLDLASQTPLEKMGRPSAAELQIDPGDIPDPVADKSLRPHPFVVQKHPDRVILLTTKKCHFYCRFCFRREESFQEAGEPDREDWQEIFTFLTNHPTIEEPILSGGDPLTLSDEQLFWIKQELEKIPSVKRWRIHSRAPVHQPQRVTEHLISGLAGGKPLRIITHFNHALEITEETTRIARLCDAADITLLNQSVLLAGINDAPETQRELWQGLIDQNIDPYYLHHPDRAQGNSAFRVTIERGRGMYTALQKAATSALPLYVLDLPDGRGKIPVMEMTQAGPALWTYTHPDGSVSKYTDFCAQ